MRRLVIDALGAAPRLEDAPAPEPREGEIVVRVHSCGLNFADLLMIDGHYQEQPTPPFTPGMEIAGTVLSCGPGVDRPPPPGTRVVAYAGQGGLAQIARVPARRCVPMPDSLGFTAAAGFLIAYGTSHLGLTHRARLQPDETLLVLGAAGGVGLTAVEIGRQLGARVIACARGREKLRVAQEAGAEHLIDSDTDDLRCAVKALGGADVVYDPVGGKLFYEALRATRPGGRILVIGFASGEVPPIPANLLLVKNLSLLGVYWGAYLDLAPQTFFDSVSELMRWQADGRLHPHVSHVLPMERAGEGLDLLRRREATGKIVITTG